MPIACKPLDEATAPAWDRFVESHSDGTFFHRAAWADVIHRAFGHETYHVFAERDGAITGVLPLVYVRSVLFGKALVSSPFCVYAGPLAADRESMAALVDHTTTLQRRLGLKVAEFRFLHPPADALPGEGWATREDLYATFRRPISADDDANMKAIPRKQRAMVRKGIERGLRSIAGHDVDGLHRIYAESVHNLGTPVFSRSYFRILAEAFRDRMDVVAVLDGETPVAAVLNFYDRDEVLPYYGGGTGAARAVAGNDFMYWEVMRRATARGCRLFDFGRSKVGTGAFSFKKNWGFAPQPLRYQYHLSQGVTIPDRNPLNPKYRRLIEAWKRLPRPVANTLGPLIVRGVG